MPFIFAIFVAFFSVHASEPLTLKDEVRQTLRRAEAAALELRQTGDHWNLPLYMGTNYVAQYYLLRSWLERDPQFQKESLRPFDKARLRDLLIQSQLADGSWQPTPDPDLTSGSLDATIMNYWALKVLGGANAGPLARAQRFVVDAGGLEKASTFSRIFCALFSQLSWSSEPWAPLFFINPANPSFMNIEGFPQWVRPHIVPIAYLSSLRVQRDLGPQFSIAELHARGVRPPRHDRVDDERADLVGTAAQMLQSQRPLGSWGGYTSATLFTVAALDDYLLHTPAADPAIRAAMMRGLDFVDGLYLNPRNPSAYRGSVCDGRYWDSILVFQGLLTSHPGFAGATEAARFLEQAQMPEGGIPFGRDFEATPDLDDTAEFVTTLQLHDPREHASAIARALRWLASMQNNDGGWGAFDRNNTGNVVLRWFAGGLADSATLFDPSTPDVTGHALEAFAVTGATASNSAAVKHAIAYLRGSANDEGVWPGRWGVNYIYGTNAVLSGLLRAGLPTSDPMIQRALNWLVVHQNPADGGFGESTQSYLNAGKAGKGTSTPTQTAWALMSFVRAGLAGTEPAARAVAYLLKNSADGRWQDDSVVGTGTFWSNLFSLSRIPRGFPMIALGEYLKAVSTPQICRNVRASRTGDALQFKVIEKSNHQIS